MLAQEAGVAMASLNYLAYPGGDEVVTSLISNTAVAGLSIYNDFRDQIEGVNLRALALSAAEPLEGVDVPTFRELGVDVEMANWRGYVAPPGIDDATRDELIEMVTEMHDMAAWDDVLARNNWVDSFLTGDEFGDYLSAESERVEAILKELGL